MVVYCLLLIRVSKEKLTPEDDRTKFIFFSPEIDHAKVLEVHIMNLSTVDGLKNVSALWDFYSS